MVSEPQFHQIEKDLFAGEVGVVESPCLDCPVGSEFFFDSLCEEGEEEEFFFSIFAEEVELGVVEDLSFGVLLEGGPGVHRFRHLLLLKVY